MSRTIAFDPEVVLDAALALFWERGFGATSLPEIERATGLNRSSLYNTFGSKRDVFYAALDRFRARGVEELAAALDTDRALDGIEAFLRAVAFDPDQEAQLGCLLTNTAVELAPSDPDASRRAAETFGLVRDQIRTAIEQAQSQGDVAADADADALARLLQNGVTGLRVAARSGAAAEDQDATVDALLAALR